ncbi:MAG: hypothetical protein WCE21_01090 [Candidatus Babeliales bacterium]
MITSRVYTRAFFCISITVACTRAMPESQLGPVSVLGEENCQCAGMPEDATRVCVELQKVLQEEGKYYYNHIHLKYPYLNQEQLQERMAPFRKIMQDTQASDIIKIKLSELVFEDPTITAMIKEYDPKTFEVFHIFLRFVPKKRELGFVNYLF